VSTAVKSGGGKDKGSFRSRHPHTLAAGHRDKAGGGTLNLRDDGV